MSFFDELVAGIGDITPEKIFSFDEINFTDDPGMKKCFVCGDDPRARQDCHLGHVSESCAMIPPWLYTRRSTSMKV